MRVQFMQKQEQAQKLSLTPAMWQSLECLQLSVLDLFQYVQEAALETPCWRWNCLLYPVFH